MWQFRLTKYDPAHRDARGAYTRDDWTSIGDIGRAFEGVTLTDKAYHTVEDQYVETLLAFVHDAGLEQLTVTALEADDDAVGFPLAAGDRLHGEPLAAVMRAALRQTIWCKLSGPGGFYIHFGYDLYAYVGTPHPSPRAQERAAQSGLFLEPMASPYAGD
jgi:hypothetical protein